LKQYLSADPDAQRSVGRLSPINIVNVIFITGFDFAGDLSDDGVLLRVKRLLVHLRLLERSDFRCSSNKDSSQLPGLLPTLFLVEVLQFTTVV
jgi:hypothetical protein